VEKKTSKVRKDMDSQTWEGEEKQERKEMKRVLMGLRGVRIMTRNHQRVSNKKLSSESLDFMRGSG